MEIRIEPCSRCIHRVVCYKYLALSKTLSNIAVKKEVVQLAKDLEKALRENLPKNEVTEISLVLRVSCNFFKDTNQFGEAQ